LRFRDMKPGTAESVLSFCRDIWSDVVRLTGRAILDTAFGQAAGGEALVDAVCSGRGSVGLARVQLSPTIPVVAVGAPARIYYEEVGRRLGAEVVFPPSCEVANAVGAATGVVARSVTVTIDGDGGGVFRVHAPDGRTSFGSAAEAVERAEFAARAMARAAVIEAGGEEPEIHVSVKQHLLPDAVNSEGLLSATVTAEAVSRPVSASPLPGTAAREASQETPARPA
jgi:hypothetical protein